MSLSFQQSVEEILEWRMSSDDEKIKAIRLLCQGFNPTVVVNLPRTWYPRAKSFWEEGDQKRLEDFLGT